MDEGRNVLGGAARAVGRRDKEGRHFLVGAVKKKESFSLRSSDKEGRHFLGGAVKKKEDFPGRRREKEGRLSWKEE